MFIDRNILKFRFTKHAKPLRFKEITDGEGGGENSNGVKCGIFPEQLRDEWNMKYRVFHDEPTPTVSLKAVVGKFWKFDILS